MKRKFRLIHVDGVTYGWRVTSRVISQAGRVGGTYVNQLMAFRDGTSGAALQIVFTDGAQGGGGVIPSRGLVTVRARPAALNINLNGPATVALLIRHAVQSGWSGAQAMKVDDGFAFTLAAHGMAANG